MERKEIEDLNYWNEDFKELENWKKVEILATDFFLKRGLDARLMKKCNTGYDILVKTRSGNHRIDVKWAGGKLRNKDELQFHLRIKQKELRGKGKTTDFFLLCFHQIRNGKKGIAAYLIPYNFFNKINDFSLNRYKVREDIAEYELSTKTLRKLGILPRKIVKKIVA